MLQKYIKQKKTTQYYYDLIISVIKKEWLTIPSVLFFFIVYFYSTYYLKNNQNYIDVLKKVNDQLINASSIITAIIITYLVTKVLQIRQEKIAKWDKFYVLTQKVHNFRNAVYILYKSWNFWVPNLKNTMEGKYKSINFYDVRKVTFVDSTTMTNLASEFINDNNFGDTKNLYLELRSFFPYESSFLDPTIYTKFDVSKFYNPELLELWSEFKCGDGLYYFFNYKYGIFKDDFFFQEIPNYYREEAKQYALLIDKERYHNVEFGHELFDLLGRQFTEDILPKLYPLAKYFNSGLPGTVVYVTTHLLIILAFGIIIPFFNSIYTFNPTFGILSISLVLTIIFHFIISFFGILKREVQVSG